MEYLFGSLLFGDTSFTFFVVIRSTPILLEISMISEKRLSFEDLKISQLNYPADSVNQYLIISRALENQITTATYVLLLKKSYHFLVKMTIICYNNYTL